MGKPRGLGENNGKTSPKRHGLPEKTTQHSLGVYGIPHFQSHDDDQPPNDCSAQIRTFARSLCFFG